MGKFNFKDFFSNFFNKQELEEDSEYENENDYSLDMQDDDPIYDDDDDDMMDGDDDDDDEKYENRARPFLIPRKKKITKIQDSSSIRMRIIKPTDFREASEACSFLKAKNSVILNLDSLTKEDARRFLDYISGAVDITSR